MYLPATGVAIVGVCDVEVWLASDGNVLSGGGGGGGGGAGM